MISLDDHEYHASDYMKWIACGHQFELETVLKRTPAWRHPAAINGSAIHAVIWHMHEHGAFDLTRVQLAELYHEHFTKHETEGREASVPIKWGELNDRDGAIAKFSADALDMLDGYQKDARNQTRHVLAAECEYHATIGGVKWAGRADQIADLGDGTVEVLDFKSSARKPGKVFLTLWPQAYIYALAAEAGAFRSFEENARVARVTWVQLRDYIPYKTTSKTRGYKVGDVRGPAHYTTEITPQGMASTLKEMKLFVEAVLSGHFERRPSDGVCGFCKVAEHCLMGHRGSLSDDMVKSLKIEEEDYE